MEPDTLALIILTSKPLDRTSLNNTARATHVYPNILTIGAIIFR